MVWLQSVENWFHHAVPANEPYHNIISGFRALSIHIDGKGIYQTMKHYQQIKYENFLSRQHTVFTLGYKNRLKQIVPMSKHGSFFFYVSHSNTSFKQLLLTIFNVFLFKAKRTINWTRVEVFLGESWGKRNDKIQYWLPWNVYVFLLEFAAFLYYIFSCCLFLSHFIFINSRVGQL